MFGAFDRHLPALVILVTLAQPQRMRNFFGPLETQIRAPQHQQRRNRPRRKIGKQQPNRQQDQQLVAQRPLGDPPDHRQFTTGFKPMHVFWRDGGIVNHCARRLGARFCGLAYHVIHGRGRDLCDGCHIIQQRNQSAHACLSLFFPKFTP